MKESRRGATGTINDEPQLHTSRVGTAEILGGAAAAAVAGGAAALASGQVMLKPLTPETVVKEMTPLFTSVAEKTKHMVVEYVQHNPPPKHAKAAGAWTQAFTTRLAETAEGKQLAAKVKQLVEKGAHAELYREAGILEKPFIAFRAAPASVKVAILGAAALGAGLLLGRRKSQSFADRIVEERRQPQSDERGL